MLRPSKRPDIPTRGLISGRGKRNRGTGTGGPRTTDTERGSGLALKMGEGVTIKERG